MIAKINTRNQIDQAIDLTTNALSIQKKAFHITSENMANADTVTRPGQKPYQKKVIIVTERHNTATGNPNQDMKVQATSSPGKKVYDPGHPYADEKGYKTVSDVNATQEMVNALNYKANIDRLTRLHKMGYDIKKQDIDLLAEK